MTVIELRALAAKVSTAAVAGVRSAVEFYVKHWYERSDGASAALKADGPIADALTWLDAAIDVAAMPGNPGDVALLRIDNERLRRDARARDLELAGVRENVDRLSVELAKAAAELAERAADVHRTLMHNVGLTKTGARMLPVYMVACRVRDGRYSVRSELGRGDRALFDELSAVVDVARAAEKQLADDAAAADTRLESVREEVDRG